MTWLNLGVSMCRHVHYVPTCIPCLVIIFLLKTARPSVVRPWEPDPVHQCWSHCALLGLASRCHIQFSLNVCRLVCLACCLYGRTCVRTCIAHHYNRQYIGMYSACTHSLNQVCPPGFVVLYVVLCRQPTILFHLCVHRKATLGAFANFIGTSVHLRLRLSVCNNAI